jgi:hypothetical protein
VEPFTFSEAGTALADAPGIVVDGGSATQAARTRQSEATYRSGMRAWCSAHFRVAIRRASYSPDTDLASADAVCASGDLPPSQAQLTSSRHAIK